MPVHCNMIDTSAQRAGVNIAVLAFLALLAVGPAGGRVARAAVPPAGSLAAQYPGDVDIAKDPSVVWYEDFSEGSLAAILARYDSHKNQAGMALVTDHPPGSPSRYALRLTAGGAHPATDLYAPLRPGYESLYFRYYIKYIGHGPWHHSGVWIGGYNPPLRFPYPRAGLRPSGRRWYSIGLEPIPDFAHTPMDLYTYWRGMHSWRAVPTGKRGDYWGNTLLHDPQFRLHSNTWECYEIHLKLNPNPASASGAVLEVWQNDHRVRRFDDRGPLGYWVRDKFCPLDATGPECTRYRPAHPRLVLLDQRWRTSAALKINYFWPQNYNTASTDSSLLLADIVIATRRIGCLHRRGGTPARRARHFRHASAAPHSTPRNAPGKP